MGNKAAGFYCELEFLRSGISPLFERLDCGQFVEAIIDLYGVEISGVKLK